MRRTQTTSEYGFSSFLLIYLASLRHLIFQNLFLLIIIPSFLLNTLFPLLKTFDYQLKSFSRFLFLYRLTFNLWLSILTIIKIQNQLLGVVIASNLIYQIGFSEDLRRLNLVPILIVKTMGTLAKRLRYFFLKFSWIHLRCYGWQFESLLGIDSHQFMRQAPRSLYFLFVLRFEYLQYILVVLLRSCYISRPVNFQTRNRS